MRSSQAPTSQLDDLVLIDQLFEGVRGPLWINLERQSPPKNLNRLFKRSPSVSRARAFVCANSAAPCTSRAASRTFADLALSGADARPTIGGSIRSKGRLVPHACSGWSRKEPASVKRGVSQHLLVSSCEAASKRCRAACASKKR